jgi:hypothetical protein
MAPYLSPEWVQAFNDALAQLDLSEAVAAAGAGSVTASGGRFAVAQEVHGAPDGIGHAGTVRTVLTVEGDLVSLSTDPDGALAANVTIALGYDDALAIARGETDPATALAGGRVRVRGELAVLVAGQSVLNAAAAALGHSLVDLTD